jgi:predicted metal-binding protein
VPLSESLSVSDTPHHNKTTEKQKKGQSMKRFHILWIVPVATLIVCAGCRSSATTTVNPNSASAGQQLVDLKKALDSGAITQKEYDAMRKAIIKRND